MRLLPYAFYAGGLLCVLYAFVIASVASMPYPDPTPALLAAQRDQIDQAWQPAALAVPLGLIGVVIQWRNRQKPKR